MEAEHGKRQLYVARSILKTKLNQLYLKITKKQTLALIPTAVLQVIKIQRAV